MLKDEYAAVQGQLLAIVSIVAEMPLDEFILAGERAQAIGPFIDPTLWQKGTKQLDGAMRLAIALRVFQAEMERQMAEVAP